MYSNIFLISDGCLIFDTLGFLKQMEEDIKNTVVWTGGNVGSLVVFLRSLGYNIDRSIDKLSLLKCIPSLVFGGNLEVNSDKELFKEIEEWVDCMLEEKRFFKSDITLKEVNNLSGIFPNFITHKDDIIGLNPKDYPDVKLKDAVLASICSIGVYTDYKEYTSFSEHDVYPKYIDVKREDYTETLFLSNYTELSYEKNVTYVNNIEDSLTKMYFRRVKQKVKHDNDIILINGYHVKYDYDVYTMNHHVRNGATHYDWFRQGENTKNKMKYLRRIVQKQL